MTKQRVVVLSLQRLGDVLTAARVTAALRDDPKVGQVEVVHWTQTEQAACLLPGVDRWHGLPYRDLRMRSEHRPLTALAGLQRRLEEIREGGYHRVINMTSTPASCLLAPWLARSSPIAGPYIDDGGRYCASHPAVRYLNGDGVDPERNVFVHQDLYTLAAGVTLSTSSRTPTDRPADRFVRAHVPRLREGPIALHLHSSAPDKDWRDPLAVDGWWGLAAELARRFGLPIVLLGAPKHGPQLHALAAKCGASVCTWPLRETLALLRHCRGLVSVDTVAIHLAALARCPTVVLRQGSARGLAFVPGPKALLVDDARTTASVGDVVHLVQRHVLGMDLRPRIARSLAARLRVRRGYVDSRGYLGASGPSWLPDSGDRRARAAWEADIRRQLDDAWHGPRSSTAMEASGW